MTDTIVVNGRMSFRYRNIWFYFVILVFLKPQIAEDFHILDLLFNVGRVVLATAYSFALVIKSRRLSKVWILLCLSATAVFLLTVLNNGIISKAVSHYFPSVGLLAFFLYNKNHTCDLCKCFVNLEAVLLIFNLLSFLLLPDGIAYRQEDMVPVWLLGQKQDLAGFVFPFLFFSLLVSELDNKNRKMIIVRAFVLSLLTLGLEQSIAAFGCLCICILLCVLSRLFYSKKSKNQYYILLLSCIIIAFIFSQYISYNFDDLKVLQELLGEINTRGISKTRSLYLRFIMWKFGWNTFSRSPLLGVGELSKEAWKSGIGYYHSIMDNIYMDILTTGGLLGITIFCYNIGKSMRYLSRKKRKTLKYANFCLFALCLYCLTGSPFVPPVFLMFTSSSWLPSLKRQWDSYIKSEVG